MKLTKNELVTLASAVLMQMRSPHIPEDCPYFLELDTLYTKLVKELEHVEHNQKES